MSSFECLDENVAEMLETRFSCVLIFNCTLAEFRQIKWKIREHLDKLVYQKVSLEPLWAIPKKEVEKLGLI